MGVSDDGDSGDDDVNKKLFNTCSMGVGAVLW